MADYRKIVLLLLEQRPYRKIEAMADRSHGSIARACRVLCEQQLVSAAQVEALTIEDLDRIFSDGRKSFTGEFVPIMLEKIEESTLTRIVSHAGVLQFASPNMRRQAVIDANIKDHIE